MQQSVSTLMQSLRRALRDEVLPELHTDHARSQIGGMLDILGRLDRLLVWSPDALRERLAAMQDGCTAIASHAAAAGITAPPVAAQAQQLLCHADLEQAVDLAEQQIATLTDWLFDPQVNLPHELRAQLDTQLRRTLRNTLLVERRLVPRGDLAAMTATSP